MRSVIAIVLMLSSLSLFAEDSKYRVVWKSKSTGATGHGEWVDEKVACYIARIAGKKYFEISHYLESQSSIRFPAVSDSSTHPFTNGVEMKVGDTVAYRLPKWPAKKARKGRIQGFCGTSLVFVDGMAIEVSCIKKHTPKRL